ncbi:fungal-specific transcription factor domain-containing protein [Colletotrichum godetiae]|uniref:Fungal-specific transcription factor domain-containing protein n=1 Tax=Colletotrichum godetiae TaxID=1209918 RepID=A0AAJ0AHK4_9PEZI|nr:fungal-specific transcription factor domain-containing protein [Colletotrichum godetiae]KAK1674025.1 fungal-specific transcription factor domain-containing protein [Colletotrichum godetiae]
MSDPNSPARRRRGGDFRARSGCRTCRGRHVKCPEQHPICDHCQRLGLACQYEVKLSWQAASKWELLQLSFSRRHSSSSNIDGDAQEWMFLNSHAHDFEGTSAGVIIDMPVHETSTKLARKILSDKISRYSSSSPRFTLSPIGLHDKEAHLWHYFDQFIAPRCVVSCDKNPYRQIILRIAASSPDGPVMQAILAASAQQMQVLGHGESTVLIWDHRNRALELLRGHVFAYSEADVKTNAKRMLAQEIMASTMMMCFFEILHDCSDAWKVHANFGKSFLMNELVSNQAISSDSSELFDFAAAYFTYHDALASTAGTNPVTQDSTSSLCHLLYSKGSALESLSGCSRRQTSLLSEISDLTSHASCGAGGALQSDDDILERTNSWHQKRDAIERNLHLLKDTSVPSSSELSPKSAKEENSWLVSELKRLTCLLYFYARVDDSNPSDAHMIRLTGKILGLLPYTSLQTNTVLWPLFIVATLGVRSESDSDRKLILKRLHLLQQTRQLGNVRKARLIVENVWKARDIDSCNGKQGWAILEGRYDAISLA